MRPKCYIILKIDHTHVKQLVQRNTMNHITKDWLDRKRIRIISKIVLYDNKSATTEARTYFIICQSPLPTALGSRVLSQNKISVLVRVLVIKSIRTRTRCFISPTIAPILLQFTLLIQFKLSAIVFRNVQ